MKFKQLITSVYWEFVEKLLKDHYELKDSELHGYNLVYNLLLVMEPEETPETNDWQQGLQICLTKKEKDADDDDDGKPWINVDGKDPNASDPSEAYMAIEFVPWAQWLNMEIEPETLANFTEIEIVAHSLWEMTFCGFDEKEVQHKWKSLKDAVDKIKKEKGLKE
jgi:hypothetical protein